MSRSVIILGHVQSRQHHCSLCPAVPQAGMEQHPATFVQAVTELSDASAVRFTAALGGTRVKASTI